MKASAFASLRSWVAASLALPALACSGGSAAELPAGGQVVDNGGDVRFAPGSVKADRYSQTCGVEDPPFAPSDKLALIALGPKGGQAALDVQMPASVVVGTALTLSPDPWDGSETVIGSSVKAGMPPTDIIGARSEIARDASGVMLDLSRGTDVTYVDATAFTSVTVTIVAVPQRSGDLLTVRVALTFSDGKRLDQTFSAAVAAASRPCPAG